MPSVMTYKCLLNQSINEEVFFTIWISFHLGRAQGLVKCELSVHERKIFLIQAWCSLVTLGLENMVIENLPIFLLTSLTLNNSVLKSQTIFLHEGNIVSLPLPESLLVGDKADVCFWSGSCPALGLTTQRD